MHLGDTFLVREQHTGMAPTIRVINNFKSNSVTAYAWTPCCLRYRTFEALKRAAVVLKEEWEGELLMERRTLRPPLRPYRPRRIEPGRCRLLYTLPLWSVTKQSSYGCSRLAALVQ